MTRRDPVAELLESFHNGASIQEIREHTGYPWPLVEGILRLSLRRPRCDCGCEECGGG